MTEELKVESLGERFPAEQERVRELLREYESIGAAGAFGAAMIRDVLRRAELAAASGDVLAMLRSFEELKGCTE